MTRKEIAIKYKENENLIRSRCWSFVKTTGLDFDDFFDIGIQVFMESVTSFDPEKSKFSTHLYQNLNNTLINYVRREHKHVDMDDEAISYYGILKLNPRDFAISYEKKNSLSDDAKAIIDIVFYTPAEVLNLFDESSTKKIRGSIVALLRKKSWSWPRIWSTMRELKVAYS